MGLLSDTFPCTSGILFFSSFILFHFSLVILYVSGNLEKLRNHFKLYHHVSYRNKLTKSTMIINFGI